MKGVAGDRTRERWSRDPGRWPPPVPRPDASVTARPGGIKKESLARDTVARRIKQRADLFDGSLLSQGGGSPLDDFQSGGGHQRIGLLREINQEYAEGVVARELLQSKDRLGANGRREIGVAREFGEE